MRTLIVTAIIMLAAAGASAHRPQYPRQGILRIAEGDVEWTVREVLEEDVRDALLDRFDRDGSGALDGAEASDAGGLLAERARRSITVRADGKPVELRVGSARVESAAPRSQDGHAVLVVVLDGAIPGAPRVELELIDAHAGFPRGIPLAVEAVDGGIVEPGLAAPQPRAGVMLGGDAPARLTWLAVTP